MSVPNADTIAQIERIFAAQAPNLQVIRATGPDVRKSKLHRLKAAIEAHAPAVFGALSADLGKPQHEALTDFGAPLWEIDLACAGIDEWMAPKTVSVSDPSSGSSARILYEPKGRVLIFAPWNYPFGLALQPLVAAIAAGNAAVVKPSEFSPATSAVIADIIRDCFDQDEVAVIEGGTDVAQALLGLPFDHIFFTGSTNTGREVMAAAARHLASVTLELGGKSPVIIDEDYNLADAAQSIMAGKFCNAGQICVAPDHIWIPASRAGAFVSALISCITKTYYEDGRLKSEILARIVNARNVSRLCTLVDEAVAAGARLDHGGDVSGLQMEPTILSDVPPDSSIMRDEIFGPVLPVLTYTDINEVVARVESNGKPLALYVFSNNDDFVDDVLSRTSSGGVTVNDVVKHPMEPELPFGGVGASGMGAYHGVYGFQELSHRRAIYTQGAVRADFK